MPRSSRISRIWTRVLILITGLQLCQLGAKGEMVWIDLPHAKVAVAFQIAGVERCMSSLYNFSYSQPSH